MKSELSPDTKMPRVLIAGHLPPPMSGIGTYYQTLPGLIPAEACEACNSSIQAYEDAREPRLESGRSQTLYQPSADCVRFTRALLTCRPEICHIATGWGTVFS